ncbi:hypothetical protein YC2023_010482 [Brassica napus]
MIWTAPGFKGKIDVQFIAKDTVLFRIENEALRHRVIKRRYWHISDVPLVLHEWSPETAAEPPDLSAMPLWVDLKSAPSHFFSQVGLKALSKPMGNFVKLHPQTEKCTRLDMARVLIEVNLHKPLIEVIKFADQDGNQVMVSVAYPWLPSRCSICSKWGHKAKECVSKKVVILNKEEDSTVVIVEADPEKRIGLGNAKEVVDGLLQELESLPIGGDSENVETATEKQGLELSASCGWLTATKTFKSSSLLEKFEKSLSSDSHGNGSASSETDMVIVSPSRFQPLLDDEDSVDAEDTVDNLEEGEIRSMAKTKDKKGGSQAKRSKKGY